MKAEIGKGGQVAIIAACLAAAGWMLYRHLTANTYGAAEVAHVQFFLCIEPGCAEEYAVRPGADLGGREADQCPECGNPAEPAARCPACGRLHRLEGHGRYRADCPHCGEAMPPLVEQLREAERAGG